MAITPKSVFAILHHQGTVFTIDARDLRQVDQQPCPDEIVVAFNRRHCVRYIAENRVASYTDDPNIRLLS